jgi:hypothetical protein
MSTIRNCRLRALASSAIRADLCSGAVFQMAFALSSPLQQSLQDDCVNDTEVPKMLDNDTEVRFLTKLPILIMKMKCDLIATFREPSRHQNYGPKFEGYNSWSCVFNKFVKCSLLWAPDFYTREATLNASLARLSSTIIHTLKSLTTNRIVSTWI